MHFYSRDRRAADRQIVRLITRDPVQGPAEPLPDPPTKNLFLLFLWGFLESNQGRTPLATTTTTTRKEKKGWKEMDIFFSRLGFICICCLRPSHRLNLKRKKWKNSPLTAGGVYDDGLLAGEATRRTLTARLAERNDGSEALRPLTASGLSSSSSSPSASLLLLLQPPLFPPQPILGRCGVSR